MLIHCDRRATTKTGPFRPKAGTNMGVTCHECAVRTIHRAVVDARGSAAHCRSLQGLAD